jgi:proline iminopeptidase
MKRTAIITLFSAILITSITIGCGGYFHQGDYYWIRSAGADLPVWVRGNVTSGTFIMMLHGGPGDSAFAAATLQPFRNLEDRYAVVYWDQRGAGNSQGNPADSTFTLEQYIEDTDAVVELVKQIYTPAELFLYGHSWGGALGMAYSATPGLQSKLDGLIISASGHNLRDGLPLSLGWTKKYAFERLPDPFWQEVYNWCDTSPDMTKPDNYFKYATEYLSRTSAFRLRQPGLSSTIPAGELVFDSFISFAFFLNKPATITRFNVLDLNLDAELPSITLPVLLMWGEHDGSNVLAMGNRAYSLIGSTDKSFVLFTNSAHEIYSDEPARFVTEISTFIDAR